MNAAARFKAAESMRQSALFLLVVARELREHPPKTVAARQAYRVMLEREAARIRADADAIEFGTNDRSATQPAREGLDKER